jgi:predicted 3-demethylubiquinone-9 3-methyltransferase (glyoxalase superfamily)
VAWRSVKVAAMTFCDQRCMTIEVGPPDPFNHSFSIIVECDDQAEIDCIWDSLKDVRVRPSSNMRIPTAWRSSLSRSTTIPCSPAASSP